MAPKEAKKAPPVAKPKKSSSTGPKVVNPADYVREVSVILKTFIFFLSDLLHVSLSNLLI